MAIMANSPKLLRLRRRAAIRLRRRKHHFDEADEFDDELLALGAVDQNGDEA
jgi:hypothetical protein